jgi:hypothetical protein
MPVIELVEIETAGFQQAQSPEQLGLRSPK